MSANPERLFIRRASDARATDLCPVSPPLNPLGWATLALAAFPDHSTLQQGRDDIAAILIEQTSNIGHLESVVEEEVANCNGSFGLGIEIHRVSRHVKSTRMDLESVSGFTVGLFHLDISSLERKSESHGKQRKRVAVPIVGRGGGPLGFISHSVERPANHGSSTTSPDPGDRRGEESASGGTSQGILDVLN